MILKLTLTILIQYLGTVKTIAESNDLELQYSLVHSTIEKHCI
jgi:hypothetical protein